MPIEYYLAAGVALIVLVLLVFALTGKKSKRVVVQKTPGTDDLTRQVARAADALEALLAHLKASAPQVVAVPQQPPPRPAPAIATEPVVTETVAAEPVAAEGAHVEQKPRRVKLSMFGR